MVSNRKKNVWLVFRLAWLCESLNSASTRRQTHLPSRLHMKIDKFVTDRRCFERPTIENWSLVFCEVRHFMKIFFNAKIIIVDWMNIEPPISFTHFVVAAILWFRGAMAHRGRWSVLLKPSLNPDGSSSRTKILQRSSIPHACFLFAWASIFLASYENISFQHRARTSTDMIYGIFNFEGIMGSGYSKICKTVFAEL